jgi:HK97 family phage major capsid protein
METKQIVDAIEAGNAALAAHRELAEKALAKAEKNEGGIGDIRAAQEKAFGEFSESQKAIENAVAKLSRANLKGQGEEDEAQATYRKGFADYLRGRIGDHDMKAAQQKAIEAKALAIGTNSGADGGYAMPKVIDSKIEDLLVNISPLRQLANVVQVGTTDYHKLVNLKGTASGWVAETASRAATTTPQLSDITIAASELYANPQATQAMLDDVFFRRRIVDCRRSRAGIRPR